MPRIFADQNQTLILVQNDPSVQRGNLPRVNDLLFVPLSQMNQWPDPFSFYQLIAWPAFFLYLASYQMLKPRQTIGFWIPANLFMVVHFYGMGSIPALCIALGAILRDAVAVFGTRRVMMVTVIIYVIYAWTAVALSANSLQDYLVAVGTTFLSLATLFRDSFWWHRSLSVCHQVM